jgi:hypothetical protein
MVVQEGADIEVTLEIEYLKDTKEKKGNKITHNYFNILRYKIYNMK